jgi:DNA-binding transcriptional MocR family regulator
MTKDARRWRKGSEFGIGLRRAMGQDARKQWLARLEIHCRSRRLTALHQKIALAMLKRQGVDGRLDPSHQTLAADTGASVSTVQRALDRLAECGLVTWCRRIIRVGRHAVEQISNAYMLTLGDVPKLPVFSSKRQSDRQTNFKFNTNSTSGLSDFQRAYLLDPAKALAEFLQITPEAQKGPAWGVAAKFAHGRTEALAMTAT